MLRRANINGFFPQKPGLKKRTAILKLIGDHILSAPQVKFMLFTLARERRIYLLESRAWPF
ncbi:hypothetical protein MARI_16920 [Marinobacter sp. JH2]|nr:hypothetical protein MARI_16920 [Marinobacter sp. JH2]